MPESTLTLSMTDLTGEAGNFLGWGRDAARWSALKAQDVREVVASALRKFYFQASVRPQDPPHQWTFLKPVVQLHLVTGEREIPLPDDFGGFEGMATIGVAGSNSGYWPLKQVLEEHIRVRYAGSPSVSGRPQAYAETARAGTTEIRSSRANLLVYPLPDQDYQFFAPYSILPNYLTVTNPYPYGGAEHAETLKAGVRAAAEMYEDAEAGEQGANYQQCLSASIQYDRRHQPKSLGINADLSDCGGMNGRFGRWPEGLWTPLGVGYLGPINYV